MRNRWAMICRQCGFTFPRAECVGGTCLKCRVAEKSPGEGVRGALALFGLASLAVLIVVGVLWFGR